MTEKSNSKRAENKELRKFGVSLCIALSAIGTAFLLTGRICYPFYMLAVVAFAAGVFRPVLLRPVFKVLTAFVHFASVLLTDVILIILFYLVVTPIGVISRLFGRDFLDKGFAAAADSYWIPRKKERSEREIYESQF